MERCLCIVICCQYGLPVGKIIRAIIAVAPFVGLAGCAPTEIPGSATRHWSLKDGFYWTWERPVDDGCVSWTAVEDWASVQLTVGSPCEEKRQIEYANTEGLTYFSVEDRIVFRGYWPWSSEIFNGRIEFDEAGNLADMLPCPNSLSPGQISEMRNAANTAAQGATTNGEKRVLLRVAKRLSAVDGTILSSSQGGCTDEPWTEDDSISEERADPWKAK